jgi:hypothetical protein
MLYVQRFQHSRQHHLKNYQSLRSAGDQNLLLCSNQYAEKLSQLSRPTSRPSIPSGGLGRTPTLLILTRVPSFVSLHNHHDSDLSILNIVSVKKN